MRLNSYGSRRRRTALHEAGHVLMAVEEGCPFGDVALTRTGEANGTMSHIGCHPGDDEAVRIALGGIVAVRLCRSRWYWQLFAGAHTDLGVVADFFRGTGDAAWGVDFNVKRTAAVVWTNWGVLEDLADELLRHRVLTHETACKIAARGRALQGPPTPLEDADWKPLVEHIHWRIKYPRGREDARRALAEGKPGDRRGA